MNKAVLLSVQPKWCELIASGRKTIEVRKTRPQLETPFKCYIYCTKDAKKHYYIDEYGDMKVELIPTKIIGEFVCDSIEEYVNVLQIIGEESIEIYRNGLDKLNQMCLSEKEFYEYGGAVFGYKKHIPNDFTHGKNLYGWRISDLKIYDTPKELGEFYAASTCKDWYGYCEEYCGLAGNGACKDGHPRIKRPPQSWMYCTPSEELNA